MLRDKRNRAIRTYVRKPVSRTPVGCWREESPRPTIVCLMFLQKLPPSYCLLALLGELLPDRMGVFLRNKLVPDPVNRPKEYRTVRIDLDLLSQFRDAVVYRSVTGALPFWPRRADQLLAGNDHPWSGH